MQIKTRYARSGDLRIAYRVLGDGPVNLVLVPGFVTHLDFNWESPLNRRFYERLASFSRLILFDKRGTGLSDPVQEVPTLEQRMDDVRAVMDDAGFEHAALFGVSEGAPMSLLFAATYPQRTTALVLHGGMARSTEAPDYPYAAPVESIRESLEMLGEHFYEGVMLEIFAPSMAEDPAAREWAGRFLRNAVSPRMAEQYTEMFLQIDVRDIVPSVHVPTLVMHRRGDRAVNVRAGRWLAERLPDARLIELPGNDHMPWVGDQESVLAEVEEFLTGARTAPEPDRVLATVMFTDIVDSTKRASELGDGAWLELLDAHHHIVRRGLERFSGREVKTLGDGFLATFDGPARAIRCGVALCDEAEGAGIPIRIGLHTGEVELMGSDVGGIAVHIASRVSSHAGAGEVIVSRTVKDLVAGSGITFEERGTHVLKGVPDDWQLYAVTGA